METKANYVLIGAFTLAVVAAAFGFVFWFQNLGAAAQRTPLRIVFEGAASGLRTGGNVNFNGIKIGEVTSIKLDDPKRVVVIAAVDKNAPIRKDSLVGLEFAGLTGVSSVSIKGGSVEANVHAYRSFQVRLGEVRIRHVRACKIGARKVYAFEISS